MIEIKRENNKVILNLTVTIPTAGARVCYFSWLCEGEEHAGLLTEAMRTQLSNAVKAAREEAYNEGWADAKAERPKCNWFRGNI